MKEIAREALLVEALKLFTALDWRKVTLYSKDYYEGRFDAERLDYAHRLLQKLDPAAQALIDLAKTVETERATAGISNRLSDALDTYLTLSGRV